MISVVTLAILAVGLSVSWLRAPVNYSAGMRVDSLFYQAHVYELQGESESAALHRAFSSRAALSYFGARTLRSASYATWVKYAAGFYRRRWLAPAVAATLFPIIGTADRSMLYASFLGYVLLGPLLFALLRRRFTSGLSLVIAGTCLLLPPLRSWAGHPLTDTWGLAMEVAALLAALIALERGGRWIAVWGAAMLALSVSRDATIVLITAVGWIAVAKRSRRNMAVLGTGVAASVPAVVLFGAPLAGQLAYMMQGAGVRLPNPDTWSWVLSHYPARIASVLHKDAVYPGQLSFPLFWYGVAAATLLAFVYGMLASPRRDSFFMLHRAALVGAAATVALSGSYTSLRVELVFVPSIAVGVAFTVQRLGNGVVARLKRMKHSQTDGAVAHEPVAFVADTAGDAGAPTRLSTRQ